MLLVTGLSLLFASSVVKADMAGTWLGIVPAEPTKFPLTLTITDAKIGTKGDARFGAPNSCNLKYEISNTQNGKVTFTFTESGGGYCDKFIGGFLDATFDSITNTIAYTLQSKSGKTSFTGLLGEQ